MKSAWLRLIVCSLFLMAILSCSEKKVLLATLIPDNTLGFIQINQAEKFLENVNDFGHILTLDKIYQNKSVKTLVADFLKSENIDINTIDLSQSIAVAFFPPLKAGEEFRIAIFVPMHNALVNAVKLGPLLSLAGEFKTTFVGNYVIFYTGDENLNFPPANPLKVPASTDFQDGTITIFGDISGILKRYLSEWETIKTTAKQEIGKLDSQEKNEDSLGANSVLIGENLLNDSFEAIEQASSVGLNISINSRGIRISAFADFQNGSPISQFFQAIGPGQGISAQSKFIPANFTYAGALNGNSKAFQGIYKKALADYTEAIHLEKPAQIALQKMIDDSFGLLGNQASFGIDLTIDQQLRNTLSQANLGNLATLFSIDIVSTLEVNDSDRYLKFLSDSANSSFLKDYLDKVSNDTGLQLSLTASDQKDGDFSYKTMKLTMRNAHESSIEKYERTERLVTDMLNKLEFSYAGKGNTVYLVMGKHTGITLRKLIESGQLPKSAANNELWKAYLTTVPADAQFVGNLSTAKLLELARIVDPSSQGLELRDGERSGIFSYCRIGTTSIEASSFWDIREIAPIAKMALKIGGKLISQ